jgi:hypothetical protein
MGRTSEGVKHTRERKRGESWHEPTPAPLQGQASTMAEYQRRPRTTKRAFRLTYSDRLSAFWPLRCSHLAPFRNPGGRLQASNSSRTAKSRPTPNAEVAQNLNAPVESLHSILQAFWRVDAYVRLTMAMGTRRSPGGVVAPQLSTSRPRSRSPLLFFGCAGVAGGLAFSHVFAPIGP